MRDLREPGKVRHRGHGFLADVRKGSEHGGVFLARLCDGAGHGIEANIEGEAQKNALGTPMQLDGRPEFYPLVILGNAMNRAAWGRHPELSAWLATTRLDPMAHTIAQARKENPAMLAPFADIREKAMAAMPNLARLAKIAHEGGK